jgi:hypothetical protein
MLNMIPVNEAAVSTMRVIDAVQDLPPEHQVVAITSAFKLLAERFNVAPQDAFTITSNIMNNAEGRRPEFEAVKAYLQHEL